MGRLRAHRGAAPKETGEGQTLQQEIKAINDVMDPQQRGISGAVWGFAAAGRRLAELQRLPEAKVTEGVSIDDYSTWRATRLAARDEVG